MDSNQRMRESKSRALTNLATPLLFGAVGGTRIPSLQVRSMLLYPVELRPHNFGGIGRERSYFHGLTVRCITLMLQSQIKRQYLILLDEHCPCYVAVYWNRANVSAAILKLLVG